MVVVACNCDFYEGINQLHTRACLGEAGVKREVRTQGRDRKSVFLHDQVVQGSDGEFSWHTISEATNARGEDDIEARWSGSKIMLRERTSVG